MRSNMFRGASLAAACALLVSCADRVGGPMPMVAGATGAMAAVAPAKVLITQVYGGGGNTSSPAAPLQNDFVELFNAGGTTQDLSSWSVQYGAAAGNFQATNSQTVELTGSIEPGQYYLIKMGGGTAGVALPPAEVTSSTSMAAGAGKVALVNQKAALGCGGSTAACDETQKAHIIDLVGYGSVSFSEGASAPTLANNRAAMRNDRCVDTNNNAADFSSVVPAPRNSASTKAPCVAVAAGLGSVTVANASVSSESNVTVTANVFDTNGQPFADPVALTWTSADPTIAELVSQSGNSATFKGHGTGGSTSITVKATAGTTTVTASPSPTITVVGPLDHVVVSGPTSVAVGSAITLTATLKDAADQTIADPSATFTWTSTDDATAKVDAQTANTASIKGVIAGGPITINVSATLNGVTKSPATAPAVTVTGPPVIVPSSTIVSELHYDSNVTDDAGEAIEFEGNAGSTLTGWTLVLYNGNGGVTYQTLPLSGTFPATCGARGVIVLNFPPQSGGFIQNGAPDGLALVNPSGQVTEFTSYEGTMTATNGPASGLTSKSIGVLETNSTAATASLQRSANGVWFGPSQNSFGACNPAETRPAETITLSGRTTIPLGMQMAFRFDGTDGAGNPLTAVAFSSDNTAIATVDQDGIVSGVSVGSAGIIATAPDGSQGKVTVTVYVPSGAANLRLGHNEEFGEPHDADASDDVIINRSQYTVSYNPNRGGANWVSWNISASHITQVVTRCDGGCYSADTALARRHLAAYTTADWVSNVNGVTGYDRGHMAPSADWTSSEGDNVTTFFLSNFLPQRADLNQGPWEVLESALRDTVKAGREVYVIAGGIFTNGVGLGTLLDKGKIGIPDSTWKIAVITPAGTGINPDGTLPPNSRVMAVNMPNVIGIRNNDWRMYLTTVAKIQRSTGYDFLDDLSEPTECIVEVRNCAPTARITGPSFTATEGQSLSFTSVTSSDPNEGDVLGKQWYLNGSPLGSDDDFTKTFTADGTYEIKLVVTDNFGSNSTAVATVAIVNVPPTVGAFNGGSVVRGETYSASGSFADPGADSWTGTVNFGDGSSAPLVISGHSFNLSHAYTTLGTFTVTVMVNDGIASDMNTATVQVNNVTPAVNAFSGATILRGETYTAAGTFTDPDPDHWTGTVNYGDGSSGPLTITGHSFSLSHAYASSGSFTVVVSLSDGNGTPVTRTATVVVNSAAQGIDALLAMLPSLGIENGEVNNLRNRLENAAQHLAKSQTDQAKDKLEKFIEEVNRLVEKGRGNSSAANGITAYARRVIASL
jgi:DNA/RNA endonuclease G (NUC1)